jgi:flagellar basal-body rod protein FlgF
MNTALYVGLSRQETLQRALDIAANNIANADTAGFKVEQMLVQAEEATPPVPDAPSIAYVLDRGVVRDFSAGALDTTGAAYDVAIDGAGFFQVQTDAGVRYTRDGRFAVNAKSQLVTRAGDPVLGDGGRPINLDPTRGEPSIAKDGTINQGAIPVGKLSVVRFADLSRLTKASNNLYASPPDMVSAPATDAVLRQGVVERSNVQPVLEITNLIEITRAYERVSKMMQQAADLSERAIQRLGQS